MRVVERVCRRSFSEIWFFFVSEFFFRLFERDGRTFREEVDEFGLVASGEPGMFDPIEITNSVTPSFPFDEVLLKELLPKSALASKDVKRTI